jgi:enoyl-CoA hydratase/carnithine racemase
MVMFVKEIMSVGPDKPTYDALFASCSALMMQIRSLPQPVIARVDGVATAAGCQLV